MRRAHRQTSDPLWLPSEHLPASQHRPGPSLLCPGPLSVRPTPEYFDLFALRNKKQRWMRLLPPVTKQEAVASSLIPPSPLRHQVLTALECHRTSTPTTMGLTGPPSSLALTPASCWPHQPASPLVPTTTTHSHQTVPPPEHSLKIMLIIPILCLKTPASS